MKKLSSLLVAAVATSLLVAPSPATATVTDCSGGSAPSGLGTAQSPYLIDSFSHLIYLSEQVAAVPSFSTGTHYLLVNNIVSTDCNFIPIGKNITNYRFAGNFDGNNKRVSGLTIAGTNDLGLFGSTEDATIKNLTIHDADVSGVEALGAVVGRGFNSILQNITVTNSRILASGELSGSVAGSLEDGRVKSLTKIKGTNNDVFGKAKVGGLFGQVIDYLNLTKLFYVGQVSQLHELANAPFGGLIGQVESIGNVTISEANFDGKIYLNVDGNVNSQIAGGLVGFSSDRNSSGRPNLSIEDSYTRGAIESPPTNVSLGGLVGKHQFDVYVVRSYVLLGFYDPKNANARVGARPFSDPEPLALTGSFYESTYENWLSIDPQASKETYELLQPSTFTSASWEVETSGDVIRDAATHPTLKTWIMHYSMSNGFPVLSWSYRDGLQQNSCLPGSYSVDGIVPCTQAPAGHFISLTGSTEYVPCPLGSYQPDTGQSQCLEAEAGTYVDLTGQSAPVPCPAGTYQSNTGQRFCLDTSPGSYTDQPGSIQAIACQPGTYQPGSRAQICFSASSGYFVADSGAIAEVACQPGTFQPDPQSRLCLDAQPGYYVAQQAATSQLTCPAGQTSQARATSCFTPSSGGGGGGGGGGGAPAASKPLQLTRSFFTGTVSSGQTVTGDVGTWEKSENLLFRYQWHRCNKELINPDAPTVQLNCSPIFGAEQISYLVTDSEKDKFLLLEVIARDKTGTLIAAANVFSDTVGFGKTATKPTTVTPTTPTAKPYGITRLAGNKARFQAFDPVGKGRISYRLNGREVAWINARNSRDKKIRAVNGTPAFSKTVTLRKGKNTLEIWVKGKRQSRVSITGN